MRIGRRFHKLGGGVHDLRQQLQPESEARSSMQPPEHMISLPGEPFQHEFTPEEGEIPPGESVDDTMDWYQREEPVRRRPPRQLRSRTIGQVKWDSRIEFRDYDVEEGTVQGDTHGMLTDELKPSWYGLNTKEEISNHLRELLHDPKPIEDHTTDDLGETEMVSQNPIVMEAEQVSPVPPIISLEGPEVESETGSFAVLSQYLITKMDQLERQFQRWYASLMMGLGKHLEQVNSSIEAIYQMGLAKRGVKKDDYQTYKRTMASITEEGQSQLNENSATGLEMNPWTAWISQIKLNEQEVPEFFRTSDAMKQTVEIVEDEEVLQTTTCTPKDIDKDPVGWKEAFQAELDSFDRLEVMESVKMNTLETTSLDILPCKVVMVKKPLGDGTHKKKGRVVVCGNYQQVQPGEETCANTPSFPMLRTLISLASLYMWAVESWDVSTAFLYAPLIEKRDVYCKPPQVLVKLGLIQPGTVWKLKKALYGLRTSPRAWEEERDRKLSSLTWNSPVGRVGLKSVDTTHCVWTIKQLDAADEAPPLGMVIAYVDDLIAVGDQSQLDCMKAELDKLYVMKTSGSIPASYQPGMEPLRFLGCLIERMPDGQIIMHQRSYIEHCFRENGMELIKGGVTLPNVDEKGSPESPVDQYGHPTEFEISKPTCQRYIGQLMWLATRTRPDISPVLGMIASQMVIRPTEMVKCLTHLWRCIKGTSTLSMTSFLPNSSSVFGKLRLNVYVDASFSSGGSRSRSGMAMYLVDTTDGSESIIQWASRRQTSMATSAPEAEVTAMAEGFATAIFLFDSLKEIQVITGFGPDCILSMKTDSAVALKQMNTHTVTVRTRIAAQKLAFLRELIYQDVQIQPTYIPGPSQRADAQTKCLSGPALRKAQEYLNLRHVVTPVVNTIKVVGVDRIVADSSASERLEESKLMKGGQRDSVSYVESVSHCQLGQESLGPIQGQEAGQALSQQTLLVHDHSTLLCRLRMDYRTRDHTNLFLQDYRRIVTVIRQEDVGVDVHDKRFPLPYVCGSSCHMPRKEEGSAHKRTKPQTPAPKGDTSTADVRGKADREAQRVERGQAKLKALQYANDPAGAPIRSHDTASESSTRQKSAKPTDKSVSSTQASSPRTGDSPIPKGKASIRKRPAQADADTGTFPATPAAGEMTHSATNVEASTAQPTEQSSSAATSNPQPEPQPVEDLQSSQVGTQQADMPVEESQPSQPEEPAVSGSVKKRMVRKGSASIAEQGSIEELGGNPPAASEGTAQEKSPVKAGPASREPAVPKRTPWSDLQDDPSESLNAAVPDTVPMIESARHQLRNRSLH